jgi:hypothetical protein
VNKPWLAWDSGNGDIEEFDTEEDALKFATESLEAYRGQAKDDGEWSEEVEYIGVYKLAHETKVVDRGGDAENYEDYWVEYGISEVANV